MIDFLAFCGIKNVICIQNCPDQCIMICFIEGTFHTIHSYKESAVICITKKKVIEGG